MIRLKPRSAALIFFALIVTAFFVIAQTPAQSSGKGYSTVDPTFVPFSSSDCGDQEGGCLIAVMTGMLMSANAPNVGNNGTRIADRMMVLTNHRIDGTNLGEAINATAKILGRWL